MKFVCPQERIGPSFTCNYKATGPVSLNIDIYGAASAINVPVTPTAGSEPSYVCGTKAVLTIQDSYVQGGFGTAVHIARL